MACRGDYYCLCPFRNTSQSQISVVDAQEKEGDLESLHEHFSCLTNQKTAFCVYYACSFYRVWRYRFFLNIMIRVQAGGLAECSLMKEEPFAEPCVGREIRDLSGSV